MPRIKRLLLIGLVLVIPSSVYALDNTFQSNVGIGISGSVPSKLYVDGDMSSSGSLTATALFLSSGTQITSGAAEWSDDNEKLTTVNANRDVKIDGDLTVDSPTFYVDSTTNKVGIGTLTPSDLLVVKGPGNEDTQVIFDLNDYNSNDFFVRICELADVNYRGGFLRYGNTDGGLRFGVHDADDKNTASDIYAITIRRSNGNVGIGDDDGPDGLLDVQGPGNQDVNVIFDVNDTNSNDVYLRFLEEANNNYRGGFLRYGNTIGNFQIGVHDADDKNTANDIYAMTIQRSDGNIGIGDATPNGKLEVKGTTDQDTIIIFDLDDPNSNNLYLRMTQEQDENYRGGYLKYDAASDIFHIGVHDAYDFLTASDYDALSIQRSDGNVGIGTASPDALLGVAGNMTVDGDLTVNAVNVLDKSVCMVPFESDTAVATGDGTIAFTVPPFMNGYNLIDVIGSVHTKGVTATTDLQIRRRRGGADADMLSTKVTIGDEWYANDEVVNTANDDLQTGDQLYVDVDAVHSGTAPNGLSVTLIFRKP